MATGPEMLMNAAIKMLGVEPKEILQTVETMRQGLFDCINNQNEILAGNRRIEAKLDKLLNGGKPPVIINGEKANAD